MTGLLLTGLFLVSPFNEFYLQPVLEKTVYSGYSIERQIVIGDEVIDITDSYNKCIKDSLKKCEPQTQTKLTKISDKPTDTVGLIKHYAKKHGVNEGLALRIAGCESGYRNVKNKYSSAAGPYQQLARYRPARAKKYGRSGYSRFHIEANIDVSIQMLKYEGSRHWNESKHCWGRK